MANTVREIVKEAGASLAITWWVPLSAVLFGLFLSTLLTFGIFAFVTGTPDILEWTRGTRASCVVLWLVLSSFAVVGMLDGANEVIRSVSTQRENLAHQLADRIRGRSTLNPNRGSAAREIEL